MPNAQKRKRIWWVGCLVLVLAMLGHDALMATVAHAATVGQAATSERERGAVHHAAGVKHGLPDNGPLPEHPGDCGTTGPAVPSPGSPLNGGDLGATTPLPGGELPTLAGAPEHGWSEPLWPPGTRRALIQVYRI